MKKEWYQSKSFYGAFIFAVALWGYTSLNGTYNTNIEIPLTLELPENRALKSDIPKSIVAQFRGTGWDLFNITFFGNTLDADLDLSNKNLSGESKVISKTDMLNSLKNLGTLEARSINSDPFAIFYGRIIDKKVPIIPDLELNVKDGFKLISDIKLEPDSVLLTGSEEILDTIDNWKTKTLKMQNVSKDINVDLGLSDNLSQIVEKDILFTNVRSDISQLSSITIPDIEINIKGGNKPESIHLSPMLATVVVQAPIEYLDDFQLDYLDVFINYKDIVSAQSGIIPVYYKIEPKYSVLSLDPEYIYISRDLTKNFTP